jgi:hypothetical protein
LFMHLCSFVIVTTTGDIGEKCNKNSTKNYF